MRAFPGLAVAAAALLLAALIGSLGIGQTAAQSGPGEEQISVRIVARNADNDRVELGLIEDGRSADGAILPSARFLSWAIIDAADVTDWRYSSAVEIGGGERGATVRIAARGLRGDRIELALQRRGADGEWSDLPAPQSRFFTRATTHTRWLRSSPIQVAPLQADPPLAGQSPGPVAVVTEQAPAIDALNCEPASPAVGETITCSADLGGGEPDSWAWSGGDPAEGEEASFTTSFDSVGDQTISLTVANTLGDASASTTFTVQEAPADEELQAPVIDAVSCKPTAPVVDETVACSASLSGGAPASWAWQTANGSGAEADHSTSFSKAGDYAVSLTVTNAAGSADASITLTVFDELQPPTIDGIDCAPSSPVVGEDVTCTATLSGGAPASWAWSDGSDNGDGDSYTTSFSEPGDYTVSLTVANDAGDATQSTTVAVQEPPPPPPTIDSLSCSAQLDGVVRCSAVVGNDGSPVSYAWSGGGNPATGSNAEFVTSFDSVGDRTISLTVSNDGGSTSDSTTVAVTQAIQPPALNGINCSPESPNVNDTITCTADLSGGQPDFYIWRGGGDPPGGSDASFTTTFTSAGDRTISLAVSNIVGDDSDSTDVSVKGPMREPVLDGISCLPNPPTVGQTVTCSAILGGGPPDTYTWGTWGDGDPAAGSDATFTTTFASAGNRTVTLQVANEHGSSITHTFTFVVLESLQAPVVDSVSCEPVSPTVGQTVTCTGIVSGGEPSTYAWTAVGGDPTSVPSGETYTTSFSEPGSKTITFTVMNDTGTHSKSTTVNVVNVQPLQLAPDLESISCEPTPAATGQPVTCSANLSGGQPDSYSWATHLAYFPFDGSGGQPASGSDATFTTTFAFPGIRTVTLQVANDYGSSLTLAFNFNVGTEPPQAPVIDGISCEPASPAAGDTITCSANLSGGPTAAYTWWADGGDPGYTYGRSATFTTTFAAAGNRTIKLQVGNEHGSATDTLPINIAG